MTCFIKSRILKLALYVLKLNQLKMKFKKRTRYLLHLGGIKMKKIQIIISLFALMIFVAGCSTQTQSEQTNNVESMPVEPSSEMKTFVLTGGDYWFEMNGQKAPEIRVKIGDKIRVEFTSTQGFHDFVVDEFNAATQKVRENEGMTFVEFTVDKTGTFEYYCSVGQHRANGMVGNLIV